MKDNFQEIIKQKTDKELEIIAKDYQFYSNEERILALSELESRNSLTEEMSISKQLIEQAKEDEEDVKKSTYKIQFNDLLPQKGYLFTPLLIYANIFVFLLMALFGMNVFEPQIDTLVQWGGNIRYLTINGQFWRLFTSVFLHGGIVHLLFNMYALLYVGSILEKVIGKNKFIFAYLIAGIAASVSSIMMNENVVSVGASGAIFGMFGVLIPLLASKNFDFPDISIKNLLLNISVFVGYNIMIGFSKSGIDNAAHIGGLLTGIVIGYFYCMIEKEKMRPLFSYTILILILGVFSTLVMTNVSDKMGEYDKVMNEFAENEQKAVWMYQEDMGNIPDSLSGFYKEKLTKEGIDLWDKNLILLGKIKDYDYSEQYDKLMDMLIDYSLLRRKSCELMIELMETESPEIGQNLLEIHTQIENKVKEMEDIMQ